MAAKWTFFYYCNAESDLFDNVITMMKNMAALKYPEQPEVNILVMVDRIKITRQMEPKRYYTETEYSWSNTLLFVMKPGMEPVYENAAYDYGDVDMGDEVYIKDFISWGIKKYPADHYGLVFYGHGSAVSIGNMMEYQSPEAILKNMVQSIRDAELYHEQINGVIQDHMELAPPLSEIQINQKLEGIFPRLFKASSLKIAPQEIQNSMELSFFQAARNRDIYVYNIRKALLWLAHKKNFRPDLIIFESCFMLSYESTLELYDLTDYIIGSQGFHSRAMTSNPAYLQHVLNHPESYTPESLSKFIIRNIEDRLQVESIEIPTNEKRINLTPEEPDAFLEVYAVACIETRYFKPFNDSFNNMINLMQDKKAIHTARKKCLTYYINKVVIEKFVMGVIDLLSFIEHLRDATTNDSLKNAAAETARLLKKSILIQKSGIGMTQDTLPWYNPTGISILFPLEKNSGRVTYVGAVLINAYMYNDNFHNYVFSTASNWPTFIKPRLHQLF